MKFTQHMKVHIFNSRQKSYNMIIAVGGFFFFSDSSDIMACFMACKRGTSDCRSQQALSVKPCSVGATHQHTAHGSERMLKYTHTCLLLITCYRKQPAVFTTRHRWTTLQWCDTFCQFRSLSLHLSLSTVIKRCRPLSLVYTRVRHRGADLHRWRVSY